MKNKALENIGLCPICDREMYQDGHSINRHHFIPKSRGGKEQLFLHRICHDTIHSLWTEKELEKEFSDPDVIKNHEKMQSFLHWIKNKDSLFYMSTRDSKERKNKRKGK